MKILIARHSGFCEGVERAYCIALSQIKKGRPVFMLGNLVHNAQVVEKFKAAGVKTVKKLSEIPAHSKGVLLISAHGVPPEIYREAEGLGLNIVDTTCPWVQKAQKIAKDLSGKGRTVVIIGDKGHAEVAGLVGWSRGKAVVVEETGDIQGLGENSKIGVIAQTTQAESHFQTMVGKIKEKVADVKVFATICHATSQRQAAATELSRKVDLMLVIGDKMSANTKRLTELCSQTNTETRQIQAAEELKTRWLAGKEKVGVTAGASTPEWIVAEVVEKLKSC